MLTDLNEDALKNIFDHLNLEDKTKVRQLNRRFKTLSDEIPIQKLIIFNGVSPVEIVLKHMNEHYSLNDTVCVTDLNSFFKSPTIQSKLKSIKILSIESTDPKPFELDGEYNELEYLSLTNVLLKNGNILRSPNLKYLILDHAYFREIDQIVRKIDEVIVNNKVSIFDQSYTAFIYQFNELKSTKLKYVNLKSSVEPSFVAYCLENPAFKLVEELDISIFDFEQIGWLTGKEMFPNLKILRVIVDPELNYFATMLSRTNLEELEAKLPRDVKVYLLGIPFNKKTTKFIVNFVTQFQNKLRAHKYKLELILFEESYKYIKQNLNKYDLTGFLSSISMLSFGEKIIVDQELYKNMQNVETLSFDLFENPSSKFKQVIRAFPNLKTLWMAGREVSIRYGNDVLDYIAESCPNLINLAVDNRNCKVDFNFLFKLPRLNFIKFNVGHPIDQAMLIKLSKQLKYVQTIDIRFIPSSIDKDQLRSMKKAINDSLKNSSRTDLEFIIQLRSRTE